MTAANPTIGGLSATVETAKSTNKTKSIIGVAALVILAAIIALKKKGKK